MYERPLRSTTTQKTTSVPPTKTTKKTSVKGRASNRKKPRQSPALLDEEDPEREYEVEKILDKRIVEASDPGTSEIQYLIKWKGYGPEANSWEPLDLLGNCKESVDAFERCLKKKITKEKQQQIQPPQSAPNDPPSSYRTRSGRAVRNPSSNHSSTASSSSYAHGSPHDSHEPSPSDGGMAVHPTKKRRKEGSCQEGRSALLRRSAEQQTTDADRAGINSIELVQSDELDRVICEPEVEGETAYSGDAEVEECDGPYEDQSAGEKMEVRSLPRCAHTTSATTTIGATPPSPLATSVTASLDADQVSRKGRCLSPGQGQQGYGRTMMVKMDGRGEGNGTTSYDGLLRSPDMTKDVKGEKAQSKTRALCIIDDDGETWQEEEINGEKMDVEEKKGDNSGETLAENHDDVSNFPPPVLSSSDTKTQQQKQLPASSLRWGSPPPLTTNHSQTRPVPVSHQHAGRESVETKEQEGVVHLPHSEHAPNKPLTETTANINKGAPPAESLLSSKRSASTFLQKHPSKDASKQLATEGAIAQQVENKPPHSSKRLCIANTAAAPLGPVSPRYISDLDTSPSSSSDNTMAPSSLKPSVFASPPVPPSSFLCSSSSQNPERDLKGKSSAFAAKKKTIDSANPLQHNPKTSILASVRGNNSKVPITPHSEKWEMLLATAAGPRIAVENLVDNAGPPSDLIWLNELRYSSGVPTPDVNFLTGCNCLDRCDAETCSCLCEIGGGSSDHHGPVYDDNSLLLLDAGHFIQECNVTCTCGAHCGNRVVQRGRTVKLEIFRCTDDKGWGVRAAEDIHRGQFIEEYVGEVITREEADGRDDPTYMFDLDFFVEEDNISNQDGDNGRNFAPYCIDARHFGNLSRFINHSCNPNVAVWTVIWDQPQGHIHHLAFFAVRDIRKGEEITFNYSGAVGGDRGTQNYTGGNRSRVHQRRRNKKMRGHRVSEGRPRGVLSFMDRDDKDILKCRCGAPNCRGIIG
ncbi:hypothetical protein HK102_008476 [Quaeritorhiza haematococci]|nr:hypothetical protein HK102_008476 [Quaeritorhiza haematococci]